MVLHCTIVGFGTRAVSRKTPIYFINIYVDISDFSKKVVFVWNKGGYSLGEIIVVGIHYTGWHSFARLKGVLGLIGAVGVAGKSGISGSIPLSQIASHARSRCFEKLPVCA